MGIILYIQYVMQKAIFTDKIIMRITPEQKKKAYFIMMKKNKKLTTVLRDFTQEMIEKYEKDNGVINTNQTSLID